MHLRMQPEPCFILINPFSSASRHSSLFLSSTSLRFSPVFSLSSSSRSLVPPSVRSAVNRPFLLRQPSLASRLCLSHPLPPKTAPFSQLVSPFLLSLQPLIRASILHQHPPLLLSLFHPLLLSCPRLPLVLATLLLTSLFALLHSGKTLPYPKNNPFRAVHIARSIPYVYLQEEAYTPRNPAEQPTQTDLPLFVVLLRHLHRLPHPSIPRSSTSLASLL